MSEFNKEEALKKKSEIDYKLHRAKKFKECLGNGSTIYQCEEENDFIDSAFVQSKNNQHTKSDSSQPLGDGCKVVENQEDKNVEASPVHKHHDGRGALNSQTVQEASP